MTVNPNTLVRIFIAIFLVTISVLSYQAYKHVVFLQTQRKHLIHEFYDANLENDTYDEIIGEDLRKRKLSRRKILTIKSDIKLINLKQRVYNHEYLYGITNITYVVVIQVHTNLYLFKQLLNSLRKTISIASALLIFSHDHFDHDMNKAVHTVNFARYMQIFYPYSIQLHPNVYPGIGKEDEFSPNTKRRDPIAVQKKLHWWWQVNQVFDHLEVIKNYTKTVLFLEEDNYVTADSLVILKLLEHVRHVHCPVCELISLGAHKPEIDKYSNGTVVVALEVWAKDFPSIGIAFDRTIWQSIKGWSKDFCEYNDYTWENSLKYVGSQHMDINFYLTDVPASRVFRVEQCDKDDFVCDLKKNFEKVHNFTEKINSTLFPTLVMLRIVKSKDYNMNPLGLFDDERDRELCLHLTKNCVWY